MIELLVVMALLVGLTMMAAPKISSARERSSLSSARQQLTATVAAARAAAVQKGRPSQLRVKNGVVSVWAADMAGNVQVVTQTSYATEYGVTLTLANASDTLITFEPRGFSRRMATPPRFVLQRGAMKDSVCLTVLGKLLPRGCVQ